MMKKLLILEDDLNLRKTLSLEFSERGYEVTEASELAEIRSPFDYAIVDLRLGPEYGLNAIEKIKVLSPHCRVVVLTGYASVATSVKALKIGAVDYLIKPASVKMIEEALIGERDIMEDDQVVTLSQKEFEYIEFVLARNEGNITQTARELGLHRQSLQRKLKKLP
jgi:two-component system, response regulator RegA